MPASFEQLAAAIGSHPPRALGVLGCHSEEAVLAVERLGELGVQSSEIFDAVVGPPRSPAEAAAAGVEGWLNGSIDLLLKLETSTATIMREVLRRGTGSWFSHLGLVVEERERRAFLVTDAGLNRAPSVDDLLRIGERAVAAAKRLGVERPTVGLIAHREDADPAVPGSILLGELRQRHGERLEALGATLVGPTSLDIALDPAAARAKGASVSRRCDVVIVPDIIVGNVIYKSFMLRSDCVVAGAVFDGEGKAIAVPSRVASTRERVASAALALELSNDGAPAAPDRTLEER
jgi:phosphotransacetylase